MSHLCYCKGSCNLRLRHRRRLYFIHYNTTAVSLLSTCSQHDSSSLTTLACAPRCGRHFSVDCFNTRSQTIGTIHCAKWESNHTSFYCLIGFCSAATRLLLPILPTSPFADIILFLFFFFYIYYIIIFLNNQLRLFIGTS